MFSRNSVWFGAVVVGVVVSVCCQPASAASRTWTGATNNDWFTSSNWSPVGAPAETDDLFIYSGSPTTSDYVYADDGGSITFDGASAAGTFTWSLIIGYTGVGQLDILNGADVSNYNGTIGYDTGSGQVTVSGVGSTWTNNGELNVGEGGYGKLSITNGGVVSSDSQCYVGDYGTGEVTVSGVGSTLIGGNYLWVGKWNFGTLTITDHGGVYSDSAIIGSYASGQATVSGAGSTWTSGSLSVSDGTLSLTDGGVVTTDVGGIGGTVSISDAGSAWTNSSYLNIGSSEGVATLTITNGGGVSNTEGTIGNSPGYSGQVTVSGAGSTWTNSTDLYVGNEGTGTLSISNGGEVTCDWGYIGQVSGSDGTLTVGGTNSALIVAQGLVLGTAGTATVNLNNNGLISADHVTLTSGTFNSAAGSTLRVNDLTGFAGSPTFGGALQIGHAGGSGWGSHTVGAGESLSCGELSIGYDAPGTLAVSGAGRGSSGAVRIGRLDTANGTLSVSGPGATWTSSANVFVGDDGDGVLSITDGGVLSNNYGYVGRLTGSTGQATVSGGGSTWTNSNYLSIGEGGVGALAITDGAAVSNTIGYVGYYSGSTGSALVSGAGSTWTNSDVLYVGDSGSGVLTVADGGVVSNTHAYIGDESVATGEVTVRGAGSRWTNSGTLYVGHRGDGTLSITDGGVVSNTDAAISSSTTGGSGHATVIGVGSTWTNSGALFVSWAGTGTLSIAGGGQVSNTDGYIGYTLLSSGQASVEGSGSKWTNTGDLRVGDQGDAALSITDGAAVSSASGFIAYNTGSTGVATVSGLGSRWTNSGDLCVGRDGAGTLTIADGAYVRADANLRVADLAGGTGTVNLYGGTLSVGAVAAPVGTDAFNWTRGTLEVTGTGGLALSSTGLLGANVKLSPGKALEVTNDLTVDSGVTLSLNGGSLSTNDLSVSGTARLGPGNLTIRGVLDLNSGADVEINGHDIVQTANLKVGDGGPAALSIANGAAVSNITGYLGYDGASSGEVTVTGAGSSWASAGFLQVGHRGAGSLDVSGGGAVTVTEHVNIGWDDGATGAVTVRGQGSSLTAAANRNIYLGGGVYYDESWDYGGTGSGTMTISKGGEVSCGLAVMGRNAGASGEVSVTGQGSSLMCTGELYAGYEGTGTLTVADGAHVQAGILHVAHAGGSTGTVNLEGGKLSVDGISPGGGTATFNWTGGTFEVTGTGGLTLDAAWLLGTNVKLSTGKTLDVTNDLTVDSGVTLSLNGGSLSTNDLSVSGTARLGPGNLTIRGVLDLNSGADVEIDGHDIVQTANLKVGDGGPAALSIVGGARVSNYHSHIAFDTGSSGQVTVSGAGSSWTTNYSLYVGQEGAGTLSIANGAAASNIAGYLGYHAASSGEVTVTGAGSSWATDAFLQVGRHGIGTVEISDGGAATVGEHTTIGWDDGATGAVTVRGQGSSLTAAVSKDIYLGGGAYFYEGWEYGGAGTGTMTISEGGDVSCQSVVMGYNFGASGEVTVTGTGSSLMCTEDIVVGRAGEGKLTVADGAYVRTDADLRVADQAASTGTVNLQGGTLSVDGITTSGGTADFNWTGGALEVTGTGGLNLVTTALLGPNVNLSPGKGLDVISDLTVGSAVTLSLTGGSLAVNDLDVTGDARLRDGDLTIRGTFNLNGGAEMELDGQDLALATAPTLNSGSELTISDTTLSVPALTVSSNAVMNLESGMVSVDGTLRCDNVLRVGTAGPATIRAFALENSGAILGKGVIDAAVANKGNIALSGDSSFTEDVENQSGAKIIVSGGSAVTFFEDVDNQKGAEIRVSQNCTATYFGYLIGDGSFTGTGTSYIEGDMRPGASPGVMAFEGDVIFGPAAGLEIELDGPDNDLLTVAANVSLDGTLTVQAIDDLGTVGESIRTIIKTTEADSIIGDFAAKPAPHQYLDYGVFFESCHLTENAYNLNLFQAGLGDFDGDGDVDLDDLSLLDDGWDPTAEDKLWTDGDVDGDGDVDLDDLSLLDDNWAPAGYPLVNCPFGGDGLGAAAVPEPGTLALLAIGLLGLALWRRWRCAGRG